MILNKLHSHYVTNKITKMKLGIKKIEAISAENCIDWSFVAKGGKINLPSLITGNMTDIPFTGETAEFSAQWTKNSYGMVCKITLSASARKNVENNGTLFSAMLNRNLIFRLTTVAGLKYVIGTKEYPAHLNYDLSISGIKTAEQTFVISCDTPQGLLEDNS